jgi:hypothetical protein
VHINLGCYYKFVKIITFGATAINLCKTTQHHTTDNSNLYSLHRDNPKSFKILKFYHRNLLFYLVTRISFGFAKFIYRVSISNAIIIKAEGSRLLTLNSPILNYIQLVVSFHFPSSVSNATMFTSVLLCGKFHALLFSEDVVFQEYSPSKLCMKSLSSRQTTSPRDVPTVTVLCDLQIRNP